MSITYIRKRTEIRDRNWSEIKKDSLDIDRATILTYHGNTKSKMISWQLSKVTEDLIKIQKKWKDVFGSTITKEATDICN